METPEEQSFGSNIWQYKSYLALIGIIILVIIFIVVIFLLPGKKSTLNQNVPGFTPDKTAAGRPVPTFTPIPTPTPVPLVQGPQTYTISNKKTPSMYEVHFNTIDPKPGETQIVDLKIRDKMGTVTSVTALVKTDKKQQTFPMTLNSGSGADGVWHGEWTVNDTHNLMSVITFTATDTAGNAASVDMTIR